MNWVGDRDSLDYYALGKQGDLPSIDRSTIVTWGMHAPQQDARRRSRPDHTLAALVSGPVLSLIPSHSIYFLGIESNRS